MSQRFDTNRNDFEPYGLSVTRWQPTLMNRTDRHNEIELNFVLTEPVTFQIGGRRIIVPPGQLMVFRAAIPHQLVDPACKDIYYVATIPLKDMACNMACKDRLWRHGRLEEATAKTGHKIVDVR